MRHDTDEQFSGNNRCSYQAGALQQVPGDPPVGSADSEIGETTDAHFRSPKAGCYDGRLRPEADTAEVKLLKL